MYFEYNFARKRSRKRHYVLDGNYLNFYCDDGNGDEHDDDDHKRTSSWR